MYRDFYSFSKEPFHVTPDPEFFFLSASHKEALASIIYGIEQRKGFLSIIGEVGLGKTTVLRTYLEQNRDNKPKTIYIFNADLSFPNLLKTICREFDMEVEDEDAFETINRLHAALIEEYQKDRNVVLIIDEAQNMPVATLERLRMLSNLESSKDKLLQILLIGQPELQEKLNMRNLRQLKQRIAIRVELTPLSKSESLAYIRHRIKTAALQAESTFTKKALQLIIKEARGVPRIINILCDNALIAGFGYNRKPVTAHIVKEVIKGHQGKPAGKFRRWAMAAVVASCLIAASLFLYAKPQHELQVLRLGTISRNSATSSQPQHTDAPDAISSKVTHSVPKTEEPLSTVAEKPAPTALLKPPSLPAALYATDGTTGSPWMDDTISAGEFCSEAPTLQTPVLVAAAPAKATIPQGPAALNPQVAQTETDIAKQTIAGTPPTPQPAVPQTVTRVVKVGDTLNNLIQSVYGFTNPALLQWVKRCNPQIRDINTILVGSSILFPPYPGLTETTEQHH